MKYNGLQFGMSNIYPDFPDNSTHDETIPEEVERSKYELDKTGTPTGQNKTGFFAVVFGMALLIYLLNK